VLIRKKRKAKTQRLKNLVSLNILAKDGDFLKGLEKVGKKFTH
jgi:hypothetical protein